MAAKQKKICNLEIHLEELALRLNPYGHILSNLLMCWCASYVQRLHSATYRAAYQIDGILNVPIYPILFNYEIKGQTFKSIDKSMMTPEADLSDVVNSLLLLLP